MLGHQAGELGGVLVAAAHVELEGRQVVAHVAQRPQQGRRGPCDASRRPRRDARRAGPAGGGAEARQVDAVGDDPVLAGEVARRGVARRRRHRDDAVEDREHALEDGLAQPVPEEALGVGVEGRDDRTLGVVHGRPAQAGHERLVDVQNVELLVFEHHVDVREQVDGR